MVVDRLLGNPLEAVVPRTFQGLYLPLLTVSYKPQRNGHSQLQCPNPHLRL